MHRYMLYRAIVVLAVMLYAGCWLGGPVQAATLSEINAAWDNAAATDRDVQTISNLPDSTPLTEVILNGGQTKLDQILDSIKLELDALARPPIDLDTATLGDIRYCDEFVNA